jgi:peptidoglycan/LPS O-acetylase OafA/YrhL
MLALIAAACVYRYQMWLLYGPESAGQTHYFNAFIYYSSFARMDELLPGLALALFKNAYPTRWRGLAQHQQKLQLLAFAAVAIMLYLLLNYAYIKGEGYGFFATVFGYSLLAMAFALLLASALQPGSLLAKYRIPGAATLALWSYSLYLVHKPIGFIINTQAESAGWSSTTVLTLNIVLSLMVSGVLYKLIEAPAMKLRDRIAPSIFQSETIVLDSQNATVK